MYVCIYIYVMHNVMYSTSDVTLVTFSREYMRFQIDFFCVLIDPISGLSTMHSCAVCWAESFLDEQLLPLRVSTKYAFAKSGNMSNPVSLVRTALEALIEYCICSFILESSYMVGLYYDRGMGFCAQPSSFAVTMPWSGSSALWHSRESATA